MTDTCHNGAPQHRKAGHRRHDSMYAMTGLYADCPAEPFDEAGDTAGPSVQPLTRRDSSKCHSRNPSAGICDRDREKEKQQSAYTGVLDIPNDLRDCGILSWRPIFIQQYSSIKVFVFFLSFLVTLQQALSSGYINSVITTIEKRFDIPSSLSGLIASSYEIGNVITVIFVSYLGSRRHIPVWIAVGAVIMGIGSLVFVLPHFVAELNGSVGSSNGTDDNICRSIVRENGALDRLGQSIATHNNHRADNCIKSSPSTFVPVTIFVVAQLLLGCGGSPLLTLGTTYVDDHVKPDSASIYIGCMYSMAAFGPVLGFLLGAYLLSFHMDSLSGAIISIEPADHRWVGMWWGGFLLCGLLLILVAIPFFSFPKTLVREKEKIRLEEKAAVANGTTPAKDVTQRSVEDGDTGYGKDIKDIPVSMWRLIKNPVYVVTCLGACMELMIVSGFVVFLPKYLETQFSLGKSYASVLTGSVAIPGACIGIFFGGCLLKRLELRPKGAVQFVLISNSICLACYGLLFFLGCDNVKMAGTTIPYYSGRSEPFTVNLTAACNFGCSCTDSDVEPVCGNNGLTYFSPCHAGCTAFESRSNYTNCACVHDNLSSWSSSAGAHVAALHGTEREGSAREYDEVTVVPVATAGACNPPCTTIFPFLVLLFFMTFVVAVTQMPLLMIVLRSVSEEERSFALGMQFVIFRLFGYIPAPIVFGNLIDSTCILWKSSCGEKGGRCLLYDIEKFRYRYVGLCAGIKILALGIFAVDWWLVRRARRLQNVPPLGKTDFTASIISLDKLFEEIAASPPSSPRAPMRVLTKANTAPRVLTVTQHLRSDSSTIQLEPRGQARGHSRTSSRDLAVEHLKQLALKSTSGAALVCRAESEAARLAAAASALRHKPRHRRTASDVPALPTTRHRRTASDLATTVIPQHRRTASHHVPPPPYCRERGHSIERLPPESQT